jgi:hypothetical protein
MNERINQLTGQVLDELVPNTWTVLSYDEIKEIQFRTAELIIRECISVVDYDDGATHVRELLLEHFGVEE